MTYLKITLMMMVTVLFGTLQLNAQDVKSDDVLGVWMNEEKDAHVEIYKDGDIFNGKIVWIKDPIDEETGKPKLDNKNPDPELAKRPVMGLLLLKDFVFDEDEWDDGKIYDPKNGKTYSCYMEFKEDDLLKIRGYIGISMLGRTTYWSRVD